MKNNLVLITLFGVLCTMPAFAKNMCGEHEISFRGTQKPHHDEYIYSTMAAYNEADDKSCKGECKIKKGMVYECDNSYCANASLILTDTNDYVWQRNRVDKYTLFKCSNTKIADKWQKVARVRDCRLVSGFDIKSWKMEHTVNNPNVRLWSKLNKEGYEYCYGTKDATNVKYPDANNVQKIIAKEGDSCTAQDLKKINAKKGVLIRVLASADALQCSATECLSGMEKYNVNGASHCRTPEKKAEPKPEPKIEPTPAPTTDENCTADQLIKLWAFEGKKNAEGVCWPTKCMSERVLAQIDDEHKSPECIIPSEACGPGKKLKVYETTDGQRITFRECEDDETMEEITKRHEELMDKADKTIEESRNLRLSGELKNRINNAYSQFNSLTENLATKKWRNKDGKFNTARLASDGVAGVVLGTTAGLITAHVVKKGQIKNGYEDIKCTIAGQEVSGWGDELTVGVR